MQGYSMTVSHVPMGVCEDAWKGFGTCNSVPDTGTCTQGAAAVIAVMVMGHSIQQGDQWYDMQYHPRMPRNAVKQWDH